MINIIIAFRSRTESMRFGDLIAKAGVPSTLINTPRELSVGCGISVSVEEKYLDITRHLLRQYTNKQSFIGIYKLMKNGIRTIVMPIS